MRCYICNFNAEETPGTNNHVFVDPILEKEICQECYDVALESVLEQELEDESSNKGESPLPEMPIV